MAARSNETRRGVGGTFTLGGWTTAPWISRSRWKKPLIAATVVAGCAPLAPPPRAGQGRWLHGEEKALLSSPGVILVACRRGLPVETRQEGVRGLEWRGAYGRRRTGGGAVGAAEGGAAGLLCRLRGSRGFGRLGAPRRRAGNRGGRRGSRSGCGAGRGSSERARRGGARGGSGAGRGD